MTKKREEMVGTHWGVYKVQSRDNTVTSVKPNRHDSNPSPIGELLYDVKDNRYRIAQPAVRLGYLRGDSNHRQTRGKDPFVPVSWDEALNLASNALKKIIETSGNQAIYGGSYGWSSAGRFHHAQSQIHRFLNKIGGYTGSVDSYSSAAAQVITPRVIGETIETAGDEMVKYEEIAAHCDLFVAFGGISEFNNQVVPGGVTDHLDKSLLEQLTAKGTELITISPIRSDTPVAAATEWVPIRPSTDVAVMLGIAHYLETRHQVDINFIERYTVGYEQFRAYLLGETDGVVKDSSWAAQISGLSSVKIERLAEKLASANCPLVTVSLSLQRAEHGEQPFWLSIVLAAMLGSFGKSGGGVGLKWGSNGTGIYHKVPFKFGRLPQGQNPVQPPIPVARIADMLRHPGGPYVYNGENRIYPDIQLIYWAGGNPFHHHQDLNHFRQAWKKPETVIVHDSVWTATARHADIVLPVNTFMERNDLVCGKDFYITPSKSVSGNYAQSRSDYEIFCDLAERLDVLDDFSEGRDEMAWVEKIYQDSRHNARREGIELPPFKVFWEKGESFHFESQVTAVQKKRSFTKKFRSDPELHPLRTPSGKIEVSSSTIDSFGYADCIGHPKWYEKTEWLGAPRADRFSLHMVSPQPRNKLHSQFDFGEFSRKDKTAGRETMKLHPIDAQKRGISEGMLVRIFNDRGACLAGAHLTNDVMQGVICLPTGAWYCPDDKDGPDSLEYHGNPNVLTPDKGTSSLAQGTIAHSCLVEVEPYEGSPPDVEELLVPRLVGRNNRND